MPQALQDSFEGFASPKIVDHYEAYAKLLFERFGDRIEYWFTFNGPDSFCSGYHSTDFPPVITMDGGGGYHECCGNVLKAHATTYHLYRKTFQKRFKGLLETKSVYLMFPCTEQLCNYIDSSNFIWTSSCNDYQHWRAVKTSQGFVYLVRPFSTCH